MIVNTMFGNHPASHAGIAPAAPMAKLISDNTK